MKFTLSWLKDHLETTASLDEISGALTALGLEVEEVVNPAEALKDFTVAYVESAEKHPGADRLRVCQVNTGKEMLQIVCGAPNARAGIKVAFAPIGVTIPSSGITLKKCKIRDVESNGMMCSGHELELSDDHDGIIELPEGAEIGKPIATVLGLNDPVIDIAITPNRADCLGVRGIARDLAAYGLGALKPLKDAPVKKTFQSPIKVHLDFKQDPKCPYFIGCYVKGVKNGASPDWLKNRLKAIGAKSISTLVDITNYLTFDRARPLHVFDADTLKGDLTVRMAREGEKLKALDEEEYTLTPEMVVIDDSKELVSLGGVMGGLDSGCSFDTTNVYVECAWFDPITIAKTGRKLGIISDARFRFERGVDPVSPLEGIEKAVEMILELCGGEASELVIAGNSPYEEKFVTLRMEKFAAKTGISLSVSEANEFIQKLGFKTDVKGEEISALVPPWRFDIEREEDLIEEVLRLHGYDKLPLTSLPKDFTLPPAALTPKREREYKVKNLLAARGLLETVNFSFISKENAALFGGGEESLILTNPISQELSHMRPSAIPSLLEVCKENLARAQESVSLFEVGSVYETIEKEGQHLVACGLRVADDEKHWQQTQKAPDFYTVKNDVFALLEACGVSSAKVQLQANGPDWFHPGRVATVQQGPKNVFGAFGEVHPAILNHFGISKRVVVFEIYLDKLPYKKKAALKQKLTLSPYQSIHRDFAFVVEDKVEAGKVLAAIKKSEPALIDEVKLFDIYQGKGVEEGHKSLALSVKLTPQQATFTEQEINGISDKIIENVARSTGGKLRA